MTRSLRSLVGSAVLAPFVALAAFALLQPQPAAAAGSAVLIDDFGGTHRGTRVVTVLPEQSPGTAPAGKYGEAGGLLAAELTGGGGKPAGIRLDYDFAATDLTSGGANTRLFVEVGSIRRLPAEPGQAAAVVTVEVTDSSGATGTYQTEVGNVIGLNIAPSFRCGQQTACFRPAVDFRAITHVRLLIESAAGSDTGQTLSAVLDTIRAAPGGGIRPAPPGVTITPPAGPVRGASGTTVDFIVSFSSGGRPAAVTHTQGSDDGLRAQDLRAPGTAPGNPNLTVTGGPATYRVRVGPLTGAGSVAIGVPAGIVTDAWGQPNAQGATVTVTFAVATPPQVSNDATPAIASPSTASFVVGRPGAFTVRATGHPVPTLDATGLPDGLSLTDRGDGTAVIAGTPSGPAGPVTATITAVNGLGTARQSLTVNVNSTPAFDPLPDAVFMKGAAGSYDIDTTGVPTPRISASALPTGLSLTDHGDGTATIAGTPTGPGGANRVRLTARNGVEVAIAHLSVVVDEPPRITSSDHATVLVGTERAFTITALGYPAPAIVNDGDLPAGVSLVDNGDGTATLAGTPTGPGGQTPVTIRATNVAGAAAQSLTVAVQQAPAITSSDTATFTAGRAGSFAITTGGFPAAGLSLGGSLPDGLAFTDHRDGTATIDGRPTAPGQSTVTLRASNAADFAGQVLTITVNTAAVFTSADEAIFERGVAGSFRITTAGAPPAEITALGPLPAGLTLTDDGDGTATLAGTPTDGGSFELDLSATNPAETVQTTLTVLVDSPPAFGSSDRAAFGEGLPGTFTISTTGFPPASLTAAGTLPAGLRFTDGGDGTATISGTPATGSAGRYVLTVIATATGSRQSVPAVGTPGPATRTAAQQLAVVVS